MNNLSFININKLKDREKITIFGNNFNDNIWNFTDYYKSKVDPSKKIIFDFEHNGINLKDKKELLEEIKVVLYNRFKAGLKIRSNVSFFGNLKDFIRFMIENNKNNLSEITESDLLEFKKTIKYRLKLNAVKGLFDYGSNSKYSLKFRPYENENISKGFIKNEQTKIFKEEDWKKICVFSEKKIKSFIRSKSKEKEINKFFIDFYNENKTLKNIRFDFNPKFKITTSEWKQNRCNVQMYAALLIQAYTGMRLSEVLSLKRSCLVKEQLVYNEEKIKIYKLIGKTFKYKDSNGDRVEEGIETFWYCPEIIRFAVESLELVNEIYYIIYNTDDLFISPNYFQSVKYRTDLNKNYNKLLFENNIINEPVNSHMFRRTLARFFAKSVLDIPVEALKEQYKHFDKSITHYYMRDTEKADNSFIELMEGYSHEIINGNKNAKNKLQGFIKRNIKDIITTSKNLEELTDLLDGEQLESVNEYMATIENIDESLSPIECLTCNGVIILPDIHLDYWKEMSVLYEELIKSEPKSFWYKKEYKMIREVVSKLENKEIYISKNKE